MSEISDLRELQFFSFKVYRILEFLNELWWYLVVSLDEVSVTLRKWRPWPTSTRTATMILASIRGQFPRFGNESLRNTVSQDRRIASRYTDACCAIGWLAGTKRLHSKTSLDCLDPTRHNVYPRGTMTAVTTSFSLDVESLICSRLFLNRRWRTSSRWKSSSAYRIYFSRFRHTFMVH